MSHVIEVKNIQPCDCCDDIVIRLPKEFLAIVKEQCDGTGVDPITIIELSSMYGYGQDGFWQSLREVFGNEGLH